MNWKDTPKNQKIALISLAFAIVLFGVRLLTGSIVKDIREGEKDLIEMQSEREYLALAEEELEGGKAELALIEEMKVLDALMPQAIDAQFLLNQFTASAAKHGVEILLLEPQTLKRGEMKEADDGSAVEGPGSLPVQIKMSARFANMVRYLDEIESQNSLLSTTALTARIDTADLGNLDIAATFEIMLAPKAAPPQTEGQDPPPHLQEPLDIGNTFMGPGHPLEIKDLVFMAPASQKGGAGEAVKTADRLDADLIAKTPQPMPPPLKAPFTIDGFLGKNVWVDGEIYTAGDRIEGWTLRAIDPKRGEIHVEKNGVHSILGITP